VPWESNEMGVWLGFGRWGRRRRWSLCLAGLVLVIRCLVARDSLLVLMEPLKSAGAGDGVGSAEKSWMYVGE
jgi:hypothetical protein